MKSVLISIKPKWCELIANGKKTVEVRKTRPKIDVPFKCYIYCTKAKDYFSIGGGIYVANDELYRLPTGEVKFGDTFELEGDWRGQYNENNFLNGKVIGEFVCDRIDEIGYSPEMHGKYVSNIENLHEASCVNFEEMFDYIADGFGYAWHISNLVIYDKPKELSEFKRWCEDYYDCYHCDSCKYFIDGRGYEYDESDCACNGMKPIERPFQSWGYVENFGV